MTSTWKASAAYVDAQIRTMKKYGSMPKPWNRERRRAVIEQVDRAAQEILRQTKARRVGGLRNR